MQLKSLELFLVTWKETFVFPTGFDRKPPGAVKRWPSENTLSLVLAILFYSNIFPQKNLSGTEMKWNNVKTHSNFIFAVFKHWMNHLVISVDEFPDFSFDITKKLIVNNNFSHKTKFTCQNFHQWPWFHRLMWLIHVSVVLLPMFRFVARNRFWIQR